MYPFLMKKLFLTPVPASGSYGKLGLGLWCHFLAFSEVLSDLLPVYFGLYVGSSFLFSAAV
jgi:hypothetical protein